MSWSWEQALFLLVAGVTCVAMMRSARRGLRTAAACCFAVTLLVLIASITWTTPQASIPDQLAPQKIEDQGYVSSDTCRACHPSQYASWHRSYHRTMTQVANPEAIQAPLESNTIVGGGRRLETRVQEDGTMWVDDVDQFAAIELLTAQGGELPPDFPRVQGPVVMTTGSHHMQIYWMRGEQGHFRQLSWVWFIRDQRWLPGEAVYLQPPDGLGGMAGIWDKNCIKCHAVGGQPRLALPGKGNQRPDPKAGELGIACEACHGPAANHIQVNRNTARRYLYHLSGKDDETIVNPANIDQRRSTEVCGRCHSGHQHRKWNPNTGTNFKAGDPLEKFFSMRRFENTKPERQPSFFWGDGVSRVTGREYTAMIESKCYTRGDITCLSCHSMHMSEPNDQLAAGREGDGACLQCHEGLANRIEEHTHHPRNSSGARCLNCHMPNTTYGLLSLTRSHRIDSPTVAAIAQSGRPNACNLCHADRSLGWANDRLTAWYGLPEVELSPDEREVPAAALWLLKGDAVQRATAAWHLGWEPTREAARSDWQTELLSRTLDDSYTAVRYLSEYSLRKFPEFQDLDYDFTQPSADQSEAVELALEISRKHSEGRTSELSAALIDRLRSERIDPPITILE